MAATEREPSEEQFSVLLVCTANQCRSPMAEHLLRAELEVRALDWSVSSAGVAARPGQPMHPSAARILDRRGIDTAGWTSRLVDGVTIDRADLVLTATEAHREAVARLRPNAMARTFTLLQFAHLIRASPPVAAGTGQGFGAALVAQAGAARGRLQPLPKSDRDLADPMGQSAHKFRRCAAVVEQAVQDILLGAPVPAAAISGD